MHAMTCIYVLRSDVMVYVWRISVVRFRGRTRPGDGGIAQLGEHLLCKQGVNGSIPFISTKWAHSSAG